MAQFYGSVKGQRGTVSRLGTAKSGLTTVAASWAGAIEVDVWRGENGVDYFSVCMVPWKGAGARQTLINGRPMGKKA